MMFVLYRMATIIAGPFIGLYLGRRRAAGKEDPMRFPERLGHAGIERPAGSLIWVHAASVGESVSALPLVARLLERHPDVHVLVTTGTVTSARLMAERLPDRAIHQYVPVDRPAAVARFLNHWRPDLALWTESEFWPNLVADSQARGIPMVLVNGRMSDRSFRRWGRFGGLIHRLLAGFALCLAQSERDAERLRVLGANDVRAIGNLKSAAPPLPVHEAELEKLRAAVGDRPLWLAASTHDGEEAVAAAVHQALAATHRRLLTIIVPRHPDRGEAIAQGLRGKGLAVARRAAKVTIGTDTDVYVADTMGELGLFYRLADVVFVGGSLVPHGGQNPLEPARLGCAVIYGPHMANFADFTAAFAKADATRQVEDGPGLAEIVGKLLGDSYERARLAGGARRVAAAEAAVLDEVEASIAPLVEGL
jgi:3-deoxy-D-manno-octulosonic-acid transferase